MNTKDLRQFFTGFSTTLQVLAREGRHVELESQLESFGSLLDIWLEVIPAKVQSPERFWSSLMVQQFNGPLEIDMRDIAEKGALSGDTTTLEVIINAFTLYAFRCMHKDQPMLMEEYLNAMVYLYFRCRNNSEALDAVGTRLDSVLNSMMTQCSINESKKDPQMDSAGHGMYTTSLRFALSLTNAAIRLHQPQYAEYFVERVFKHREYRGNQGLSNHDDCIGESEETLAQYFAIVVLGWGLEVLENGQQKYHQGAASILQRAISELPSPEELIALWELYHGENSRNSAVDGSLGIANWDVRDWDRDMRPGIVETRWGGGEWRRQGLRAALLVSEKPFWGSLENYCPGTPNRFLWNPQAEREALLKMVSSQWLGIPEDSQQQKVNTIVELFEQRSQGSNSEYLRYVLNEELSEKRINKLTDESVGSYRSHRPWIDAFRMLGVSQDTVRACPVLGRWGVWIPRECLLDDNNWGSGFGSSLGESVGRRESINLVNMLDGEAKEAESVTSLATLPETMRRAMRIMRDAGYEPNALIIPREERFAGALFRKPLWQVEGRREFAGASIGDWEGLHVLKCPYDNPTSILMISTSAAIADCTLSGPQFNPSLSIDDDPDVEDVVAKRETALASLDNPDAELPESSSILSLASMTAYPTLGLGNKEAILKLSIEYSDGGYALTDDSDLYHRPSCPEIEFEDVEYKLRLSQKDGRKPCPVCKPNRWNSEGRHGHVDGESNDS